MSDIMSMLSNLFGSTSGAPSPSPEPSAPPPQRAPLGYTPPPAPVTDPLGGDTLRPGGPQPGMMDSLRTALGDKLGGFASEITKRWDDQARLRANESAGAMDPENARLAASANAPPTPQMRPGGPVPGPLQPGPGQVISDGLPNADNVGGSVAAGLRQALAGGGPAPGGPMPRPPMGGGAGGAAAPGGPAPAVGGPWQTQTQKAPGGITGADVQSFLRAVFNGAAQVNPRAPAMQAFAQGAAGAINTAHADEEKAADKATKADDKAFDRKMKTDEFGLKKSADERAGRREDRESGVSEARIQYLQARAAAALRKDGSLDSKDIAKIDQHMERWARRQKDAGLSGKEFDAAFEAESQRQKQQYTQKKIVTPGEAKGQGGVAAPPPAPPAPGEVRNGYRYKGGNLNDKSSWEKVQ